MPKPNYILIAHELGHAIYAYLYEPEQYPSSMVLKPDGSTAGCVEFEEWTDLPVIDGNIARIKGNSYLGGMFGEFLWYDRCRVMGIRGDMDEFLTELRFSGDLPRRSRSKLFKELWGWFYTDKDDWSYGGMMRRWMDDPHDKAGKIMTLSRFKKRLPETYKYYEKFVANIDQAAFKEAVRDISVRENKVLYRRTLQMYGRRIIPDIVLHPEDI